MENENKDKRILTEEELKEVQGGSSIIDQVLLNCKSIKYLQTCIANSLCKWSNGRCDDKYKPKTS